MASPSNTGERRRLRAVVAARVPGSNLPPDGLLAPLKTEPDAYAWDDLVREERDGVDRRHNPQAQANLHAMRAGDHTIIYHSGEKRAVGIAEVVRTAYPIRRAAGTRSAWT